MRLALCSFAAAASIAIFLWAVLGPPQPPAAGWRYSAWHIQAAAR